MKRSSISAYLELRKFVSYLASENQDTRSGLLHVQYLLKEINGKMLSKQSEADWNDICRDLSRCGAVYDKYGIIVLNEMSNTIRMMSEAERRAVINKMMNLSQVVEKVVKRSFPGVKFSE